MQRLAHRQPFGNPTDSNRPATALEALNMRRQSGGQVPIRFGVGLHVGVLRHGNVGSLDRLSFNVVGPAVNRTARLESLTKEVGVPLLLSRELAELVNQPVESRGLFSMKGIAEPQEVFALVGGPHDPAQTSAAANGTLRAHAFTRPT